MAGVAGRRYPLLLLGVFLLLAAWMAWRPPGGLFNWAMGNVPVVVFLAVAAWAWRRVPLSAAAWTALLAFLCLHEVGTHFGYRVPGFGGGRNGYDRVVHAAYGLLLAPPLRQALVRTGKAAGAWATVMAGALVLASAAFYEVAEWVGAALLYHGPPQDFLGFQGDSLDTTKDMAVALAGAVVALAAGAVVRRVRATRAA